jgi:hypothetical protein
MKRFQNWLEIVNEPARNGGTFIYPGGQQNNTESPALIVKFLQQHPAAAGK